MGSWTQYAADPSYVMLDGFHAVKHALRFGAEVPVLVAARPDTVLRLAEELAPDLVDTLRDRVVQIDRATFAELAGAGRDSDLLGLARRPQWTLAGLAAARRAAPLVALDNPRHLGNIGAVIRVAAGLGAAGVLCLGTVDPWHRTVLRGSAGLHFAEPVLALDPTDLGQLAGPLIALDAAGRDIREVTIPDDAVLVFGSERHGVSAAVRALADDLVGVPMRAQVSSLNLATTVAIVLHHWLAGKGPGYQIPPAPALPPS
jgi:TrmH family RNA methyltransferase